MELFLQRKTSPEFGKNQSVLVVFYSESEQMLNEYRRRQRLNEQCSVSSVTHPNLKALKDYLKSARMKIRFINLDNRDEMPPTPLAIDYFLNLLP